ncbi:MAG TPA: phenylalanine--tRNA ligase subunit beta [Solirubrobacteraceae bacterium]|nr:phenylalanine--tRNA ligase subunit beta [Solirubrobacteraceae bacterium]
MRLPVEWLHEYVRPDLSTRDLATRLAMTGTEVDRILRHGVDALEAFVVGRVLNAERHPDADRLSVCRVDLGSQETTIVCGAPNVAAGQAVAVARPGAVMPDGTTLGRATLRGVVSDGMILAEDELGIGTDHAGILVLEDGVAPGTPLAEVLPLATDVLELEITPNRPDCLGVYGVAREVHAATGAPLEPPPWEEDPGSTAGAPPGIEVVVEDAELCPRFTARVFEDVTIGPSPPWLKARLMAAGQRPISNVVDITNYVMLLTGHPLHAFDLDRVAGGRLVVRRAGDGERVTTLDGVVRTLDDQMVLIADDDGPTSIAGVMGGQRSEVGPDTTRVLMEVANWNGPNINRTSSLLGLRSEASARFEKGLAPEQALEAQAVATRLMLDVCGARLVDGTVDVGGPGPPAATLRLRDARVSRLLGTDVPRERSAEVLDALGFGVAGAPDGLDVTVPSWRRNDVTREADVIEEVARLAALEDLPATIPENRTGRPGRLDPPLRLRRQAEDVLVGCGLHEVAGWSLADPRLLDRLRLPSDDPLRRVVEIENPMAETGSILRPTIVGSLLDIAAHNRDRGHADLALFESGAVYRAEGGALPAEHHALGVVLHGALGPASWRSGAAGRADVFAAKGLLEAVFGALRVPLSVEPGPPPAFLHPGRAAGVLAGDERVGFLGEVHPLVAADWGFEEPVATFAVDLGRVVARAPEVVPYTDLVTFPALRRDLALSVPSDTPAAEVVAVVRAGGGDLLRDVQIFDVYAGEQAGEGRRSIAMHLAFRAADRTLTDDEVNDRIDAILRDARDRLGAESRA